MPLSVPQDRCSRRRAVRPLEDIQTYEKNLAEKSEFQGEDGFPRGSGDVKTSRAAGKEKRTGRRKSRTVSWGPEPGRQVPPHHMYRE